MKRYVVLAGEKSGDSHAAALVEAMREQEPLSSFFGVAGVAMRQAGVVPWLCVEQLSQMGFVDVIKALPQLICHFRRIKRQILEGQFDAVLFIDYPGFNLRMARALRRAGYRGRLIHYIAPTVWAHGRGRIDQMARDLDLLLVILPFEPDCFSASSLPVHYVGHPTKERLANLSPDLTWRQQVGIPEELPLIAFFPGSRPAELRRHLPLMLQVWCQIQPSLSKSYRLAISCSEESWKPLIEAELQKANVPIGEKAYLVGGDGSRQKALMEEAHVALAKSGTVALELALLGCPSVLIYRTRSIDRWIARYLLRLELPYYSLPNLLMGRELFPEHIARGCEPVAIAADMCRLLSDREAATHCREGCRALQLLLGESAPSRKAAQFILQSLIA